MAILGLGVSYRRASVELLERLAFTEDQYPKAYRRLLEEDNVGEAVILSTCNRVEVYAAVGSYHAGFVSLKRFLAESREVSPEEFAEPLYSHYEDDAAEHLFSVASGIDSMVLGEPQILAQVRRAFGRAQSEGAAGPHLSALFRGAVRAGRRARAETGIGAAPGAMAEAGLALAERSQGPLEGRAALVVGAGPMAALAAGLLRERRVGHLRVLNRTVERARLVAGVAGGESGGLAALAAAVGEADLVVSCTAAPGLLIGPAVVGEAFGAGSPGRGRARSIFFLDLAVPRDVDPAVVAIEGVGLADIDDISRVLGEKGGPSRSEVGRVVAIVSQEVARFGAWRRAARLAPLIQELRERGERVGAAELARVASRLAGLSERERDAVDSLARGIVAKLLHEPIVRLKGTTGRGSSDDLAGALAALFGLEFRPGA